MKQTIKDGRIDQSNNAKYTFVPGTRVITISHTNFTDQDVIVIYNETQKKLITGTGSKDLLLSVENGVITYANSLPVLAIGDKLSIDIDFGPVATETLVNEMNVDRSIICQAVRDKGQNVNDTDNSVLVASKIRAISSSINVKSTPGIPTDWHDLVEAVASVNDVSVKYKYALLIPKGFTRVYLQGANRFDMSDGVSTTNTGIYEFDTTKDDLPATKAFYEGKMAWMTDTVRIEANMTGYTGNVALSIPIGTTINQAIADHNNNVELNKRLTLISGNGDASPTNGTSVISVNGGYQGNSGFSTRWIVFSSSSPNPVQSFTVSIGDPAFSWARKIFQVFIYNVSIQGLNFDGCYITSITFDDSYRLTNGADDPANNTFKFVQQANQFRNNFLFELKFPGASNSILDSEKELVLNQQALFNLSTINKIQFPVGLQNLTISGVQAFANCQALTQIIFPAGLQNLTISGSNAFNSCFALTQIIFPAGLQNLTINGNQVFSYCIALNYIYFSKPTTTFIGMPGTALQGISNPIKIELENRWNFSIDFSSTTNLNASAMETFIIDRLLDLRSTEQENVFVKIDSGSLITWNAVKSDNSPLVGHANFQEIFRAGQVVIVNIAGTNRSYTIADIPTNNQMIMTASTSMVAGTYELNYNKIATFGATNLAKLSTAQKSKATTKKWQLA